MRLAVLGGSTPFVVPLFADLKLADEAGSLSLHGRDAVLLSRVTTYAQQQLPRWSVTASTSLPTALTRADVVLHQIRYGGLAGRAADERLAARMGVAADETLGPAALRSALRTVPPLRQVAAAIAASAPGALVVNLTNPLSVTTAVLAQAGLDVIGLCELPQATAGTVADLAGGGRLSWSYTGLNHRGFLHHLTLDGRDVLPLLGQRLPDRTALGVLGSEVTALDALPLKYFGLPAGHAPHGAGRAERLTDIRRRAGEELQAPGAGPQRSGPGDATRPPSLRERPMPWWSLTVGPVLRAVATSTDVQTVLNVADPDGLVRERRVTLGGRDWQPLPGEPPPSSLAPLLASAETHERAVLAAVTDPSADGLRKACRLDPLLPTAPDADALRLLLGFC